MVNVCPENQNDGAKFDRREHSAVGPPLASGLIANLADLESFIHFLPPIFQP
jgi:hypothetical protein